MKTRLQSLLTRFGIDTTDQSIGKMSANSLGSMGVQMTGLVLNLLMAWALANSLGSEKYGILVWAFTWTTVLSALAVFGSDALLLKLTAEEQHRNNIASIAGWLVKRSGLISATLALIGIVWLNASDLEGDKLKALKLAYLAVPVFTLTLVYQSGLKGLHLPLKGQYPEKLMRPLVLLAVLGYVALIGVKAELSILLDWQFLALVMALGAAYFHWRQHRPEVSINEISTSDKKGWSKTALWFFAGTIVGLINVRADILMLGWEWLNPDMSAVGIYHVAARIGDFVAFSLSVTTPVVWPLIAKYNSQGAADKTRKLVVTLARVNTIIGVLIGGVLVVGSTVILAVFGKDFAAGQPILFWIIAGHLITLITGPAGALLSMGGKEKFAFIAGLIAMVANLMLNLLLIPKYGAVGAAMATGISLIIWNGTQCYFAWKELKIGTTIFSRVS